MVEEAVTDELAGTALFAGLFRENAARALLLTRRRPDQRIPLWAQRLKSNQLLATVQRYPDFPLVLETYRQCLRDVFDLPGLKRVLQGLQSRQIRVHEVETGSASPFARSLVFAYVAAYIYEQDAPLAERRAQALTLDRHLLADLLGQAELRELIDADVLATLEAELQCLQADRQARDADELHDLLRNLGDLSTGKLEARCVENPSTWLETLRASGRAVVVPVAEERRWLAAEDIALYRDALGIMPPPGLPEAFLDPVERPLEHLVQRYARRHGPFTTAEVAQTFGLRPAQVEPVLRLCERDQRLVRGELRPGGSEPEWCDSEVLRQLKRRTLAKLRHQVVAVDAQALGRFLPRWQGVGRSDRGGNELMDVLAQLEGLPLSWSLLVEAVLPARIANFRAEQLDLLCASGALVWIGRGALGQKDGRVALYRREQVATLLDPVVGEIPEDPVQASLYEHLRTRGASFLVELEAAVRGAQAGLGRADFEAALWDLVWDGRITNDTVQPLRQLAGPVSRAGRGRARRAGALAGGRWSLVSQLTNPEINDTARVVARTDMLLARYGIVSREAALAEDLMGGFSPIYRALKAMEDTGAVRRGYYVEGLSGAQFARPGVVDRLREGRGGLGDSNEPDWQILAAADPANVFGSLLPWPVTGGGEALRPRRVPGSWVILADGKPVLYVAQHGAQLMTFPNAAEDTPDLLTDAFQMLHVLPRVGRRRLMVVRKIDGHPALESPYLQSLREAGFVNDYRGLTPAPNSRPPTATAL
jgi:ATP-dependent Lhr-like helicase